MSDLANILKMLFKLKPEIIVKKYELAEELQVSERQISRYKKVLDELFYIETIPGPNGGYKLLDLYFPFKELLNEEEIMILKNYTNYVQYIDNEVLKKALDKINYSIFQNNNYINAEIIPYSKVKTNKRIEDIERKLYQAILNKNEIIITYKSNKEILTKRRVQPFKLFIYKGELYLIGKCLLKNDIRYFKIARIEELIVTGFKFESDFDVNAYLNNAKKNNFGIFTDKEYKIKMIIYPPMKNTVKERIWVDNQVISELDDGSILFEATMMGGPEFISWILSMRSFAKIIEPESLKKELIEELEKMKNFYIK